MVRKISPKKVKEKALKALDDKREKLGSASEMSIYVLEESTG